MADSQRLRVLKNIAATVLTISQANGYRTTVKQFSLDPIPLGTVAQVPAGFAGGWQPKERSWQQSGYPPWPKDVLTLELFFRIDAPGSDDARKNQAFEDLAADLEMALGALSALSAGGDAEGIFLEQPLQVHAAIGNQNIVILVQPLEARLNPRKYGQP